jgi:hypothetical protein
MFSVRVGGLGFTLDALDKPTQRNRGEIDECRMFRMQGVQ